MALLMLKAHAPAHGGDLRSTAKRLSMSFPRPFSKLLASIDSARVALTAPGAAPLSFGSLRWAADRHPVVAAMTSTC